MTRMARTAAPPQSDSVTPSHAARANTSAPSEAVQHDFAAIKVNSIADDAIAAAIGEVDQTLADVDAYVDKPEANWTSSLLQKHFRSTQKSVARRVRRGLKSISGLLQEIAKTYEYASGAKECLPGVVAYSSKELRSLRLCDSFFDLSRTEQMATIIHECAHIVVGAGAKDVAYRFERLYRQLSPDEALENAESYADFVLDHCEAAAPAPREYSDKADLPCTDSNRSMALDALAKAQRWADYGVYFPVSRSDSTLYPRIVKRHLGSAVAPAQVTEWYKQAKADFRNFSFVFHCASASKGETPCVALDEDVKLSPDFFEGSKNDRAERLLACVLRPYAKENAEGAASAARKIIGYL